MSGYCLVEKKILFINYIINYRFSFVHLELQIINVMYCVLISCTLELLIIKICVIQSHYIHINVNLFVY